MDIFPNNLRRPGQSTKSDQKRSTKALSLSRSLDFPIEVKEQKAASQDRLTFRLKFGGRLRAS